MALSQCSTIYFVLLAIGVLLSIAQNFCAAQNITEMRDLHTKLLTGYNKNVRPSNNQTAPFPVSMLLYLSALRDLDEIEEQLSVVMVVIMKWHDASLTWSPAQNSNITKIQLTGQDVWKPLLTVFNPFNQQIYIGDKEEVSLSLFYFLPHDMILDRSKLKAFADDKINVIEKLKCGRVENIMGKGENAGYQHFLLFL